MTTEYARTHDLPELNLELLEDIVSWAVIDHMLQTDRANLDETQLPVVEAEWERRFREWGHWGQNHWVHIRGGGDIRRIDNLTEPRNGVCSTAFCMAGQVVAQDRSLSMVFDGSTADYVMPTPPTLRPGKPLSRNDPLVEASEMKSIADVAEERLGFTGYEGSAFFYGNNTIEQIVTYAEAMAAVRGEVLRLPGYVEPYRAPTEEEFASILSAQFETRYIEVARREWASQTVGV